MIYLLTILAGILSWSFAEYGLHNWYGHVAKGKNDFSREHLTHHARKGYFAPAKKKARLAIPVALMAILISSQFVGFWMGLLYTISFISTYLAYEHFHYVMHTYPPRNDIGSYLRKHHFYHHFHNPWKNHGVTSPIWDMVFRTYEKTVKIRVPESHVLDWLMDPQTGEIAGRFAQDYEIIRYKK